MQDSKTVTKFNTHLLNFINELNNIYPSLQTKTKKYTSLELTDDSFLLTFRKNISPFLSFIIENNDEIVFKSIFDNIDITNLKITSQTKQTIFKYINIMFIQSFKYNKSKEKLSEILRLKNDIDTVSDLETKAFLISIDNLKQNKTSENTKRSLHNFQNNVDLNNDLLKNLPIDSSIMGGSIGKLAMDIAKDIDISQLQMNNPMEMLQGIMSGDLSKSSGLQSLFGNITEKINTRLNSGEVDKDAILNDAQNIMNKTQNMTNNNYFKNIQENIHKNLHHIEKDIPEISTVTDTIKQQLNEVNNQLSSVNTVPEVKETTESHLSKEQLLKNLNKKKKKYLMKKIKSLKK